MAKAPQERYGTRLAGWFGIFVTTAVAGPAADRIPGRGFGWPDVLLAAAVRVLLVLRVVLPERALRSHAGSGRRS
jgi:hypothetical protein